MGSRNFLFNIQTNKSLPNKNNSIPPLTMYYYLFDQPDNILNATEVLFVTNPVSDVYRGITNRFMSNSTYNSYTSDIISYISCRTPKSNVSGAFDKNMYNEFLTINSLPYQNNFIQAVANYEDNSEIYETTVSENNFIVTASSGKYENYKNIKIIYDNTDTRKTRILQFT